MDGNQISRRGAVLASRLGAPDRYGIPHVRFHTKSEHDHAFAIRDEMYGQMEEILKASGAEIFPCEKRNPYPLGSVTHEAGGARVGDDSKTSVLHKWTRCHNIKNLVVVDAACFTSHPEKPITATLMALALRASDHLAEEMCLGNVQRRLPRQAPGAAARISLEDS